MRPGSALVVAFAGMALLFVTTTVLTSEYRAVRAERQDLHLRAAAAASAAGRHAEAIAEFRDALEYDRDNVAARLGLSQALFDTGRHSEAWNHLIELVVTDPTNAVVNRLLAEIARERGHAKQAASYYRAAIYGQWAGESRVNRLQTRFALIDLLAADGDVLQEVSELVELMKEMPEDIATRRLIGRLLLEAGAPAKAVVVFKGIIEQDPNQLETWAELGQAEFGRAHYLSARTAFTRSRLLGGDSDGLLRMVRLCNEIVDLDPTFRRAGTSERHRRSQELLRRSLAEVRGCLQTVPASDAAVVTEHLSDVLELTEEVVNSEVPAWKSEEFVEKNIALAEQLWKERVEACADLPPGDAALVHVLEKLAE